MGKCSEALGLSSLPLDASTEEEYQVNIMDASNRCTFTEGALKPFCQGTLSNEKNVSSMPLRL
eukprot:14804170-Ditylum_brightwellii.AAC.1